MIGPTPEDTLKISQESLHLVTAGVPALWTLAPFGALVLGMAVLPIAAPHAWERRWFQALVVLACALPVIAYFASLDRATAVTHALSNYATFIATLGALFVAAGGVYATADLEATPRTNVLFLLIGSALASFIGTTGASMLLIRPLLRTNSQRRHTAHIVPFFILGVANAGGLLTPLGDPPLLVGFVGGVPFFWTLRLFPIWLLYVGSFAVGLYVVDRRAYSRETPEAIARDRSQKRPLEIRGGANLVLLLGVIGAAFLPGPFRELGMVGIALASFLGTSKEARRLNGFSFAPIAEVALLFAGLFVCLIPIELVLSARAADLPIRTSLQLFWVSGTLSALLDNAPTYAAFAALARGLSHGQAELVSGIAPIKLAALSAGSVVMGATTYIGNGPNLMVKAIAERSGVVLPSFARFAFFAFTAMLPAHLVMSLVLTLLDR